MKKFLTITAIVLAVLIIGFFGAYEYIDQASESGKDKEAVEVDAVQDVTTEADTADSEQTDKIGGVQYAIGIDGSSSEEDVILVMHKMTHQKVVAEKKWGAIPLIPDTINQVYEIVSNSDYDRKDDLLAILEKWKNGNFAAVDEDHNYFWDYQGGTVGKATGLLTKSEEETFVLNNFGDEIAKEVSSQQ